MSRVHHTPKFCAVHTADCSFPSVVISISGSLRSMCLFVVWLSRWWLFVLWSWSTSVGYSWSVTDCVCLCLCVGVGIRKLWMKRPQPSSLLTRFLQTALPCNSRPFLVTLSTNRVSNVTLLSQLLVKWDQWHRRPVLEIVHTLMLAIISFFPCWFLVVGSSLFSASKDICKMTRQG